MDVRSERARALGHARLRPSARGAREHHPIAVIVVALGLSMAAVSGSLASQPLVSEPWLTAPTGGAREPRNGLTHDDDGTVERIDDLRQELLWALETIDALADASELGLDDVQFAVGSATPVTAELGIADIPDVALLAYIRAQEAMARDDPACGLHWSLLAGIGKLESNHGRFGGAVLREDGYGTRPIRGIPLDGRPGVALIRDTDNGELDGDTVYDRAVGPMQFIPSTWRRVAVDGNGDGRADPDNIFDVALGAAVYLCAGNTNLRGAQKADAVFRYNRSWEYVWHVIAQAAAYEAGAVGPLPSPGVLPASTPALSSPLAEPATIDPSPALTGRSSSGEARTGSSEASSPTGSVARSTTSTTLRRPTPTPVTPTTAPTTTTVPPSTTTSTTTTSTTTTTTTSSTTTTTTSSTTTTTTPADSIPAVVINTVRLDEATLAELENALGWPIAEGRYWYDPVLGAVGVDGEPTAGFVPAGLAIGGPLPEDASGGTTGVFLNGRQLPDEDLQQLEQLVFGSLAPGRYVLDAQGDYGNEGGAVEGNVFANLEQSPDGDQIAAASGWVEGDRSSGYVFASSSACRVMSAEEC